MSDKKEKNYKDAIEDAKDFCYEYELYGDFHSKVNACECLERLIINESIEEYDDDEVVVKTLPNWEQLKKSTNFHKKLYHIFKSHINNYGEQAK